MKNLTKQLLYKEIMLQEPMSCGILQAALSMLLQVWSFLFWSSAWQERKKAVFSPLVILRWASSCFSGLFWHPAFPDHRRKGEYSFKEYREHRNITCMFALVAGALFLTARTIAFRKGIGGLYSGKMYDPASSCDL